MALGVPILRHFRVVLNTVKIQGIGTERFEYSLSYCLLDLFSSD